MEQRVQGTLQIWAEPFVPLRVPKLFNLRTDPFERADITSNTYYDWMLDNAYLVLAAHDRVAQFLADVRGVPAAAEGGELHDRPGVEKLRGRPDVGALSRWPSRSVLERRRRRGGDPRLRRARHDGRRGRRAAGRARRRVRQRRHAVVREADADRARLHPAAARRDGRGRPTLRERQPWKAAHERDYAWLGGVIDEALPGDDGDVKRADRRRPAGVRRLDRRATTPTPRGDVPARRRHPTLGRRLRDCGYAPMVELLRYLEAHGFTNYIASGGNRDFMRAVTDDIYGIPPERVIGSSNGAALRGGRRRRLGRLPRRAGRLRRRPGQAGPDLEPDRAPADHRGRQLERRHPDAALRRRRRRGRRCGCSCSTTTPSASPTTRRRREGARAAAADAGRSSASARLVDRLRRRVAVTAPPVARAGMVAIAAASFEMGSDRPLLRVVPVGPHLEGGGGDRHHSRTRDGRSGHGDASANTVDQSRSTLITVHASVAAISRALSAPVV